MISRAQQILIKRAQRQAGLNDADYREALQVTAGCRSSTDPAMTDRGVDLFLAYVEAIYWRGVDAGALPTPGRQAAVFRQRGYWAQKNPSIGTSRDRYAADTILAEISALEGRLRDLGFNEHYCAAIRNKATNGRDAPSELYRYRAALRRTLAAKQRRLANQPF